MKRYLLIFIAVMGLQFSFTQTQSAFKDGEWFKFRISYSGWLKAGNATLDIKQKKLNGKDVYHVVGKGWTTGAIKWFFKVKDRYESYFDTQSGLPYKFIRKIDEGGHKKDIEIDFDQINNKAKVNNKKYKTIKTLDTKTKVQDMVSAFYYLRNNYETQNIKKGDVVTLNMFFDEENYPFRLKFLGRETIKVNLNGSRVKVKTLMFRPYVMAGRVFKEEESLTLWVSADKNKIPLRIKADLAVGSLRADLDKYKGLKHSFEVQFD
ncbi:MAG: DUF3108 domain-containing protein [Winogradskyella sp.]|uniref:DUF3108 domain-containing protein n=1 Tax=Winogradskyella sp. TaxID=1883156 RepID=UPI000F3CB99C|nr:DUF3108 domain-containing protein [Winogradskyella sp.]RNC88414.1 MAG: DUF3108 domain-containing protein [Winogradskyella sp.]